MIALLERLDRRIVFLLMGLAIAVPILIPIQLDYKAGRLSQDAFDTIDRLPDGSKVVFSFDYDPAASGELQPMANALMYHCARKRHKIYLMALWPPGQKLASQCVNAILLKYGKDYVYGRDYVELGYQAGNQGVIKIAATNLREQYKTDRFGTPLEQIEMMGGITSLQAMDLLITASAGFPGSKEWVQYFVSAFPHTKMVTGTTGVQSVSLYPYIPTQIVGMLGAIKGAAEYETIVNERYPLADGSTAPELHEGQRRMGPQLTAHLLMVTLIILGNVVFIAQRRERRRGQAGTRGAA